MAKNGSKFAIGVTAPTPEETEDRFCSTYQRRVALLEANPICRRGGRSKRRPRGQI